jgi:hypothetical protein
MKRTMPPYPIAESMKRRCVVGGKNIITHILLFVLTLSEITCAAHLENCTVRLLPVATHGYLASKLKCNIN